MCGICGVYDLLGSSADREIINQINNKMHHRGPDDEGSYFSGPVGLGMRRLSIIDTKGGHQPISNEQGTIWVVQNGEIYNYIELRIELEKKGHQFQTSTDTEVVVHLYEEEGLDGIHKLNGMFAFALYDETKQLLWIARDRIGIKPLYYAHQDRQFLFSSDLTALNAVVKSSEINEDAFISYLALGHTPERQAIYSKILKLAPAHCVLVDKTGIRHYKYWDVTQFQSWQGSVKEAGEQLHHLLSDAIRLQLRSDVPIGISLSGGVDSSAIAAYASSHVNKINTFTIDFVDKHAQDTIFAQDMAKKLGAHHTEIKFSSKHVAKYLSELLPFMDEPISDSAILASYVLAKGVEGAGIKVLLNGAGGDEIFGGYQRHHAPIVGSTAWFAESLSPIFRKFASYFVAVLNKDKNLRMQEERIAYGAGYAGTNMAMFFELFKCKDQYHKLTGQYFKQLKSIELKQKAIGKRYSRMYTDLTQYLVGDVLALSDKATMACSVEGRVPLLDHRLVEFAFSLPEAINLLDNQQKGLFRQSLKATLSSQLLSRSKEGFNAPLAIWASQTLGQSMKQELLEDPISYFKDFFQLQKLEKWVQLANQGHSVSHTVFRLYLFSRWYREHIVNAS